MEKIVAFLMTALAAAIAVATLAHKIAEYKLTRIKYQKEAATQPDTTTISQPIQRSSRRSIWSLVFAFLNIIFFASTMGLLLYLMRYGPTTQATFRDVAFLSAMAATAVIASRSPQP